MFLCCVGKITQSGLLQLCAIEFSGPSKFRGLPEKRNGYNFLNTFRYLQFGSSLSLMTTSLYTSLHNLYYMATQAYGPNLPYSPRLISFPRYILLCSIGSRTCGLERTLQLRPQRRTSPSAIRAGSCPGRRRLPDSCALKVGSFPEQGFPI